MMKTVKLLPLCVLLAACAQSSGVKKIGSDTYTISAVAAPARGGVVGAKSIALTEAGEKCQSLGRELHVIDIATGTAPPMAGTADVTFRCVDPKAGPPVRAVEKPAPKLVIEDQWK